MRLLTVGQIEVVDAGIPKGTTNRGVTTDANAADCSDSAEP